MVLPANTITHLQLNELNWFVIQETYKMLTRILSTYQTTDLKRVMLNPGLSHTIFGVSKDSCSREMLFLLI